MQHRALASQFWDQLKAFFGSVGVPVKRNRNPEIADEVRSMPEAREFCFGHSQLFVELRVSHSSLGLLCWRLFFALVGSNL
jgi:hypothetical protein